MLCSQPGTWSEEGGQERSLCPGIIEGAAGFHEVYGSDVGEPLVGARGRTGRSCSHTESGKATVGETMTGALPIGAGVVTGFRNQGH